ncbi:MAG: hypothetical protein LBI28_05355 [Treponema sp.]|jgi:hypothetical protein|nr:hypothetical protein [Treponema sp.]
MRMKYSLTFSFLIFVLGIPIYATTWDEPWHDIVVKESDSFVFARIDSFDSRNGVNLTIIKNISGRQIIGRIRINDFYLLNFTSYSGDDEGFFHFSGAEEGYFFIKQKENGNYSIATPTAGFAVVRNGLVYATYRHSYHQALVPVDIYEKTMEAIFNNYHGLSYDISYIRNYISQHITRRPAGLTNSERDIFFLQHVALETIYHLRLSEYYSEILPFLVATLSFQIQVSAIRALAAYNTDQCKNELLRIINAPDRDTFVQVISVWTLSEFIPIELKSELIELEKNASNESNGFGGNLMDPRVGTYIPSVKVALQNLIEKL